MSTLLNLARAVDAYIATRVPFTPPAVLPAAQLPRAILTAPGCATAGDGDLTATPELRPDAQGRLWVAFKGGFDQPSYTDDEDGLYIGPRPVVEVAHVHSIGMVVVVTDQDVFLMSAEEWAAQV